MDPVSLPPGEGTFANTSDADVRFLNINSVGGWEHYLRDLGRAMASGVMPGSAAFAKVAEPYDLEVTTSPRATFWAHSN